MEEPKKSVDRPSVHGELALPYLLFLGDEASSVLAKTARGLVRWRPEACLGQVGLPGSYADLGLPTMPIAEARESGARTMVIGVANIGGFIPETWVGSIVEALENGLDVANGLHTRLDSMSEIRQAAARCGRLLHEIRHPQREFSPGNGDKRSGMRLLTVGTDCAVGKMFTALAIDRELRARGVPADFRATGQTGILIAGSGVSVDAVVCDFVSGAAEWLSPANDADHWDVIEGQGAIHHPAYAGVTLGLIHGSQPDALVLCHAAGRRQIHGLEGFPTPSLEGCIADNEAAARLTNPQCRCVGISINASELRSDEIPAYLARIQERIGLPCVDPLVTGVGPIVDALERL